MPATVPPNSPAPATPIDRFMQWIGSTHSLWMHTLFFAGALLAPFVIPVSVDTVLLILTTGVSLEAIYLAIFIQRAVNLQAEQLEDVEESIDDVNEDIEAGEKRDVQSDRRSEQMLRELMVSVQELKQTVEEIKNKK